MVQKETRYYRGSMEVSKDVYERTFDSHSNTITTETDWLGRERVTKTDLFGTHTRTDSGFSEDGSEAGLMGAVVGAAVCLPVFIGGYVAYKAGKFVLKSIYDSIYYKVNEERLRREHEEFIKEYDRKKAESLARAVNEILDRYNKKISEYQELFELGVLSKEELDNYVQNFITLSNEEIENAKRQI